MKKALLFVLLCCTVNYHSFAQTVFAPPGSEWHHAPFYGRIYSHYLKDTVIAGVNCKEIAQEEHVSYTWASMGFTSWQSSLYVYNTSDTVFVYNSRYGAFTPLYVFNVNDGDTVRLPWGATPGESFAYTCSNPYFSFIVDSVRMKVYDTTTLKTVYTRSYGLAKARYYRDRYVYSYGGADTLGVYAEKIGGLKGFLPSCLTCVYIIEAGIPVDDLICYSDTVLSIKLTTDSCDIPYAVAGIQINGADKDQLLIFPNPVSDIFNIDHVKAGSVYEILSISGIVVQLGVLKADKNTLSISSIPKGIYLLEVYTAEKQKSVFKIIKQ